MKTYKFYYYYDEANESFISKRKEYHYFVSKDNTEDRVKNLFRAKFTTKVFGQSRIFANKNTGINIEEINQFTGMNFILKEKEIELG